MTEKTLEFSFKARYYQTEGIASRPKIWFVLHGYGQLSQFFIRKFTILETHNIAVVAPEGLSRFYLEDVATRAKSGTTKVGATWMTRENRETDIRNYLVYLNSVYLEVMAQNPSAEVTILGFSQGAATASRWALASQCPFKNLILWAGILPPDMNVAQAGKALEGKKIISVRGKSDPFLNAEKTLEMEHLCGLVGINPDLYWFEGGHEINEPLLLQLANNL